MKTLLIHAPIFFRTDKRNLLEDIANAAPPLGLAYLASMVKDDVDVKVIDAQGLTEKELKERVLQENADIVGISATSASAKNAQRIAQMAKRHNKDVLTILGGPHITAAPEESMEIFTDIDIGVIGDGESVFKELVIRHKQGQGWRNISGIVYRDGGSNLKLNQPGELMPLDEIPFPSWRLLPSFKNYSFNPSAYRRKPHCIVIASRGCPYKCIFCHVSRFRPTIRFRSPKNVADEIEYLVNNFGIKEIRFGDELFAVNKKWASQICEEIKSRKLNIVWTCEARADSMTPEFAQTLKKGGCWQITMGVESGSAQVLKKIKKGITLQQVKNTVNYAHRAGLSVRAFFMIGFPFESREDIKKTIRFAMQSGVDYASFGYVVPFPGTELYQMCMREGYFDKFGWMNFDSTLNRPGCAPKDITEKEIRMFLKQAYRRFYFRPAYWARLAGRIRNVEDVRRVFRGAKALIKFNTS
ncbi:MAG: radical SAM protein [Candidatus Omnitrophica bacterium]|nr:radical SAM protein [Candidatus Omnitrophota bacterium]